MTIRCDRECVVCVQVEDLAMTIRYDRECKVCVQVEDLAMTIRCCTSVWCVYRWKTWP